MQYKDGTNVPQEVKDEIVNTATATDMLISNISEGQLIIGHRDHGETKGWTDPSFKINHLGAICSQYPSVFFSINCLTGEFDANLSDCFAEAILKLDGAAPSLIAATEASGTWRNDSMIKALFDAMWSGVIPTFPGTTASYPIKYNRLGDILNYAKSYLLVAHGLSSGVKNHFEIYHVIGDPTLQIWTDTPACVNLCAQIVEQKLNINISTCPTGSVITIWYKDTLLKRIEPSSTRMSISLRDLRLLTPHVTYGELMRRPISVCFSAPGYRFTQANLRF